jgi:hypothetical protein
MKKKIETRRSNTIAANPWTGEAKNVLVKNPLVVLKKSKTTRGVAALQRRY